MSSQRSQTVLHPDCPMDCGWIPLVRAVADMAGADSLGDIIDIVRLTARDISGAEGVCFVLADGDTCHYIEENAIGPLWKGKRFPQDACISGWAMRNDRTVIVPDIYADARIPHDAYRPTFVKSLVVVPVRIGKPVAAISFYWSSERQFVQAELALIEALGRSTSAALGAVRMRESLAENEQLLSMALQAGGLGALEITLPSGQMRATPSCKALFGREQNATFGRDDLIAAIHPDERDKAAKLLETGNGQGAVFRCGDKHIELFASLACDTDGRPDHISGMVRDVTQQIRDKERLDTGLSELLRASRLNDLGAMASALAHELNQPLAAGTNYIRAAERLLATDPQKAIDAMGKAASQFTRTKEIIQRIRGFVGQGGVIKTEENIGQVCHEVMELTAVTSRHAGAQVYLKVDSGLPKLPMDKVQIQQVLANLLRNAVEAVEGRPKRQITISARRIADGVEISVADTGPGLEHDIAAHLFQPFHTTKEGGMGVGLSLCRKIVDAHGGQLRYETSEDGGAKFLFTLPFAAD